MVKGLNMFCSGPSDPNDQATIRNDTNCTVHTEDAIIDPIPIAPRTADCDWALRGWAFLSCFS